MERYKKIDKSLAERRGILHLLARLEQKNISVEEMEEIGSTLRKEGRRALSPLVRRLWHERNGELISKYAYLLDFFEDETWLEQLIQMVLRRKDLEDEGKAALLAALEGYGIDVTSPPFDRLLAEVGRPLQVSLPRLLDRGEEGLATFLDNLLCYPPEGRLAVIAELVTVSDPRVINVLEVLVGIDDGDIVRSVITALGRIRSDGAAALLQRLCRQNDSDLAELARRNLRRLAFLGIAPADGRPSPAPLPIHAAYAGPLDGNGNRTLCVAGRNEDGRFTLLYLQTHNDKGMQSASGESGVDMEEMSRILADLEYDEGIVAVSPDYLLKLVGDAVYRSRESGIFLPVDFYLRQEMFGPGALVAAPYEPDFGVFDLGRLGLSASYLRASASLFDEELFAGWFVASNRMYDFAEEWDLLEENSERKLKGRVLDSLLERCCKEVFPSQLEQIKRRLFLMADLIRESGGERTLQERVLAVASSLSESGFPCHCHPFLRRLALESLQVARESLGEGYDPRQFSEDGEW
ncbi:HEAT repeat domain-containing protein [Geobacter sp. AOG1]|uniref:HEAT repeat domain-containing protein n=1 Tax=Geobacter sp. AOG1 TaxID=1566346 RepID=UPI001CC53F21|nr:HEAT repeat domain-containing protein [Geobacter sp. AOG1]GFE56974.1 hypothetical protein AOG1_08530 [Geobacter sp. AOG1]